MSIPTTTDQAKTHSNRLVWHFAWMRAAYDELRNCFASMRSKIESAPSGSFWHTIEDDETEVARLLLMLQTNRRVFPWLVPISRTYMLEDTKRLQPGPAKWAGGEDGRDYAIRCRIAIASPDHDLFGFYAFTAICYGVS